MMLHSYLGLSQCVSEVWVSMSQLIRAILKQSIIPVSILPLLILPVQIQDLHSSKQEGQYQGPETNRMAQRVLWRIACQVHKGADKGRAVGDGNDDAHSHGPHVVRREVVRCPSLLET